MKLLLGLLDRFCELADESENLFFEERPFLEEPVEHPEMTLTLGRIQNNLEMEKILKALSFQLFLEEKKVELPAVQSKLLVDI